MSFQLALDALSHTTHRDSSVFPVLDSVSQPLRSSIQDYPWIVPKEHLPFLIQSGIQISGFGSTPHPHPVHKVLETNLLFNHWNHLCRVPSTVLFMKPSKFRRLQEANPHFSQLLNYRLSSADTARYPTTSSILPTLTNAFMHDALMYFHPSQILDLFLQCPQLETLYCSLVIPPESDFTDFSLYPHLYQFQVTGSSLHYTPESHHAGSYNQPSLALSWLKVHSITSPHLTLSITKLESWGPLHSILVQRGLPLQHPLSIHAPPPSPPQTLSLSTPSFSDFASTDSLQSFQTPDCLELPQATFLHQPLRHRLVPTKVYEALFTYTRAVRTLRVSDPAGFVRMHSNKPEHSWVTSQAWDNLQTFALLNAPIRPPAMYSFFLNPVRKLLLVARQHWQSILLKVSPALSASVLFLLSQSHLITLPLPSVNIRGLLPTFSRSPAYPPNPLLDQSPSEEAFSRHLHLLLSSLPQSLPQMAKDFFLSLSPVDPASPPRPPALTIRTVKAIPIFQTSLPVRFLLSLTPQFLLCLNRLLSPLPLQALHDTYHSVLHPPQFRLQWKLRSFHVSKAHPFLPLSLTPPPLLSSSSTAPDVPPLFPPIHIIPEPESASPPSEAALSLPADLPQPNLTAPSLTPTPAPTSEASSQATSATPLPPAVTSIDSPSLTQASIPPQSAQTGCPSPSEILFPESSGSPTVLPTGALTFSNSPSSPQTSLQSKKSPPPTPLESDPSCTGPVVPFSEAFPAYYYSDTASFHTRVRCLPPSQIAVPALCCLLEAFSSETKLPVDDLWLTLRSHLPDSLLSNSEISTYGLSTDLLTALCFFYHLRCSLHTNSGVLLFGIQNSEQHICITHTSGPPAHYSPGARLNGSAPRSNPLNSPLVRAALRFKYQNHFLPFERAHAFTTSLPHAKNLISNMKNGFDGILSSLDSPSSSGPSPREKLFAIDALIDSTQARTVPIIHIAGFAGCGKTHPIQQLLRTPLFRDFRVSCPTTDLRSEWKDDMKPSPPNVWRFSTWESSLLKTSSVLVIDEVYKLPSGYLDLSILSDPAIQLVILLGDPLQGEYHSTSLSSSNSRLESEITRLSPFIDCYCWWSYRIPQSVAEVLDVTSFNPTRGFIRASLTHPQNSKNLVNSIATANALQHMGHHAMTISSSQGVTFSEANTILLDRNTNQLSPNTCLVGLTRSRTGVIFVGNLHLASNSFGTCYIFSRALSGQPIDYASLFPRVFPTLRRIFSPITSRKTRLLGGFSLVSHDTNLPLFARLLAFRSLSLPPHIPVSHSSDVLITSAQVFSTLEESRLSTLHLPPTRLPLHYDLPPAAPSPPPAPAVDFSGLTPISHAFAGEFFDSLAAFFLPPHDPQTREHPDPSIQSNQFPWVDLPFELSCQPSSLIAAKHSPSSDPLLLSASLSKRLRFRPSENPYSITPMDQLLGEHLFASLQRAYKRPVEQILPFHPELFAECICANEYAQLSSKTQATIVANHTRSDPDWRFTAVKIFAKSQHKVNDGSIFGSWKACQTLALMHDYVILVLGPVKKYQRLFDDRDRPPNLYIHRGQTPLDLSHFCSSHSLPSKFVANDYTSFDQSQRGEAVVLELLKMQRLSIPSHLQALHLFLKTNVRTQFGPLTCMRLTGEPGTYDDNTDYNLATIFSQYAITDQPVFVSGDDSVIASEPPQSPSWRDVLPMLNLRFKTEHTRYPLFCGYYLTPQGAIRNPLALFAKLMICVDDGSVKDKILSYISEFSVGHSAGDTILHHLPSHLLPYHSACFDFFCRFATPSQKLTLSLDPIPESIWMSLIHKIRWASRSLFSQLPQKARDYLISRSHLSSSSLLHSDSQPESELLPFLN
ncbi:replication protein [Chayote mosaic virus]|uniref:Non-structural replication polyprotein n=1 Tax=Chayote mosaic virus TaxID=71030 RepID=Q9QCX3_9VIRU|nr:replication protein [Chayote mosaic virus]AAF09240.1 replication protein [Chayote mosaic virus]